MAMARQRVWMMGGKEAVGKDQLKKNGSENKSVSRPNQSLEKYMEFSSLYVGISTILR